MKIVAEHALEFVQRFGLLIVCAVALVAVLASGVLDHLTLAELSMRRAELVAYAAAHPLRTAAIYIGLYIVVVSLSLPFALIFTLTGGLLFGPIWGGLAAVTGATLGSTVMFLACRTAIGDWLRSKAGPRLLRIENAILADAFTCIIALRLIPAFPLWIINIGAGLVAIPLRTYFVASFLGMVPSSLVYASVGSGFGHVLAKGGAIDVRVLTEPQVWAPLIGLGLLSLTPLLYRRLRGRVAGEPPAA
ncbi:MAG: hypothetical protein BGN86_06255 [Caulobacterales bacterium 68-7]|nr:TVP38/TMEM64 family protein [Caulobacterales bacterium]OJU13542.1 MAG: hypothetical protein BGN86_06255 [Caulobacterales bacterium 68-7]